MLKLIYYVARLFFWQALCQDAESSKLKGISLFSGIAALELGLSELIPQDLGISKISCERGRDETGIIFFGTLLVHTALAALLIMSIPLKGNLVHCFCKATSRLDCSVALGWSLE